MPRDVGVIVVAAGRGTRLGGSLPKQYRPLAGVPLVLHSLRPFLAHPDVRQTILVLPPADAAAPPAWLAPHLGEALQVRAGGDQRTDSVAAGLDALDEECTTVLVHDGARPFVERDIIDAVIARAREGTAACAAIPVTDTIKEAESEHPAIVARTLPREHLWRAQTPQGFPRPLLALAHAEARRLGLAASDDAALVERVGGKVHLVPDSPRNFKVTTPDDLLLAEWWAERRG